MIFFFGAPGMRISFSPIFTRLPALLFGPVMGGMAGGIVDVLGYILKPEGAYIPLMTLTAILDGVLTGLVWKGISKAEPKKLQTALWVIFALIGVMGGINMISTAFYPDSLISRALEGVGKNKEFLESGLLVVAGVGILLLVLDIIARKVFPQARGHKYYIRVLIAYGVAGLVVTVLNTFILQIFIPDLGKMGFIVFLMPRLVKEVFMMVIQSYIAAFLISIYYRIAGPTLSQAG
jgi:ECF transporter S component (folate family)